MDVSVASCFVTVSDHDQALTFYRDALGLEVRSDVSNGEHRWVTLSPASQPDLQIVLQPTHGGRSQADGDSLLELVTKGSFQAVILRTPDLDEVFEKLRASGAEVMQEPMDQPWGVRDCAFRDPSGNMVRINQA